MKKEYRDSDLYDILHFTPEVTPEMKYGIEDAYAQIRKGTVKMNKNTKIQNCHRKYLFLGLAAAFLIAFGFWGFSNPVLAGKIPFIGRIFRLVEKDIGYSGDYSENAVPLAASESKNGTENANAENSGSKASGSNENAYSQTVNGVTVTLSEASYSELALYFSVEIYCEEGFPEDFNRVQNMKDYMLSYDVLNMLSAQKFDFSQADSTLYPTDIVYCSIENGFSTPYSIEGNYADSHTFLGVIRVELDTLRRTLDVKSLPPEFTYSFTLQKFWHDLNETASVIEMETADGYPVTIYEPEKKVYEGPWEYTIPVSMNQSSTQTKELMQTNDDGIGIANVIKTPYEIMAELILPKHADPFDYIIAITDADGKLLDSQGENAEVYSVYNRNTDTVHIYVVDYDTFMDECKGDNAGRLPEKALFQTTVKW